MKKTLMSISLASALIGGVLGVGSVLASDHDDGTTDMKTKNTNLTDLYVFRETDQNAGALAGDMIFILNCNDRALARQRYFFNTTARYEFHVSRVTNNDNVPNGADDMILRFEFDAPDGTNRQKMTVTAIADGQTFTSSQIVGGGDILTTDLDAAPTENQISLNGSNLSVFAGLREDPFFFDVDNYFRLRADFADGAPNTTVFRNPGVDFTAGYNVLSIVARIPKAFLQGPTAVDSFDVWETISITN